MTGGSTFSRRRFLRIVAAGSVSGVLLRAGWRHLGDQHVARESRILMGTAVNLTVVGDEPGVAASASAACLDRMGELEAALSRFRPDSQVSRLNRDGGISDAGSELLDLLALSRRISEASNGAFDITVKPVLELYQRCATAGQGLPGAARIHETLDLVGHREVLVDGARVRLARPKMGITLDGIAKGYIVDAAVEALRQRGFTSVLVEAGGDLMAAGERPSGGGWRTGIRSPRPSRPDLLARLALCDQAAATSGDYLQAFSADLSAHHVIDPRTGASPPELASVTVVAPRVALADALSTAVMVAGPRDGARLLQAFPGCCATLVTKSLETIQL